MGRDAGAGDVVLDHAAEIVALVGVDEGVVDADIGEAADQDQRLGLQRLQQDLAGRCRRRPNSAGFGTV